LSARHFSRGTDGAKKMNYETEIANIQTVEKAATGNRPTRSIAVRYLLSDIAESTMRANPEVGVSLYGDELTIARRNDYSGTGCTRVCAGPNVRAEVAAVVARLSR
jgi:hypothetical protein